MGCTNGKRPGFTMLELVLVLVILAVLAGLVVSIIPNLVHRTHLAKCADTIAELNKVWQRAYALNTRYPDIYDSLMDVSQEQHSRLPRGLQDQTEVASLAAEEVAALRAVGITSVVDGDSSASTYDYAPFGTIARPLSTTPAVMELLLEAHEDAGNLLNLKRHLVRQADGTFLDNRTNVRYVIFGIGPSCTAVGTGRMIQEAPVHFGASDEISPAHTYQRYLVVYSIVQKDGNFTAYFEGAAGNDVDGPSSAEVHTQDFHAAAATEG